MAKSWRPEKGWHNPHVQALIELGGRFETEPQILGRGKFIMPPPLPGKFGEGMIEALLVKAKDFEVGADAMLAALRKSGVIGEIKQSYGMRWPKDETMEYNIKMIVKADNMLGVENGMKGIMVFIPDDEVK